MSATVATASSLSSSQPVVRNHVMNGGEPTCGQKHQQQQNVDIENSTGNSNSGIPVNGSNNSQSSSSASNNNNKTADNSSSTASHQQLATTLVQYQGFGSFHSENVEELIRLPDSEYQKPKLFPNWAEHYPCHSEIKFLEAYTDSVESQDYPLDVAVAAANALPRLALGLPTRRERGCGDEKNLADGDDNENNKKRHVLNKKNRKNEDDETGKIIAFGEPVSRDHFYTDTDNWCFVNHGAFGGSLRGGTFIKRRWEDYMEQQPLQFVDRTVLPSIVYCLRRLAGFFNCRPQDLVPASNATLALNAAINACVRHHTDVVAYLDLEYGSVWKMLREAWNWTKCTMHEIEIYPHLVDSKIMGDDEAFTNLLESKLPAQLDVMVIDHVTSNSAMLLPVFTHIIPMLRRRGVNRIVVDGAHGALQFPLDFNSLREDQLPTYYAGNLHKWVCVPKSAAFMWVHPSMQHKTHSPIVTHGARAGMLSEFAWEGTKEYGAFLSIPAILDFWERKCGVDRIRQYIQTLLTDADKLLCDSFGVQSVPRGAPFMRLVPLPTFFNRKIFSAKFVQDTLHKIYRVEVPVKDLQGALYMRVSAFIYNDIHDYERLRDCVLKMRAVLRRKFAGFIEAKLLANGGSNGKSQSQPPTPAKPLLAANNQDAAAPSFENNNNTNNNNENASPVSALILLTALAELFAATNAVQTSDLGKPVLNEEFESVCQQDINDDSPLAHFNEVLDAFEMLEKIQQDDRDSSSQKAATTNENTQEQNSRSRSTSSSENDGNNTTTKSTNNNNKNSSQNTTQTDSNSQKTDASNSNNNNNKSNTMARQASSQDLQNSSSSNTNNNNNIQDDSARKEARDLATFLVGKKPCPDSSKSGGCGVGGINTMITTAFSDTDSDSDNEEK